MTESVTGHECQSGVSQGGEQQALVCIIMTGLGLELESLRVGNECLDSRQTCSNVERTDPSFTVLPA